jgi:6-phosphogluconate dehydrogenase (decarboxylating)
MEAGYLGVGAMGQPMAHKLLDAGHGLAIYDINESAMQPLLERQARRGVSPRDLVLRLNQKIHTADRGSPAIQRLALGSARERLNLLTVSVH